MWQIIILPTPQGNKREYTHTHTPSVLFCAHFLPKATYALIWASEPVGTNFTPVSSLGRAPPATELCTLAMVVLLELFDSTHMLIPPSHFVSENPVDCLNV